MSIVEFKKINEKLNSISSKINSFDEKTKNDIKIIVNKLRTLKEISINFDNNISHILMFINYLIKEFNNLNKKELRELKQKLSNYVNETRENKQLIKNNLINAINQRELLKSLIKEIINKINKLNNEEIKSNLEEIKSKINYFKENLNNLKLENLKVISKDYEIIKATIESREQAISYVENKKTVNKSLTDKLNDIRGAYNNYDFAKEITKINKNNKKAINELINLKPNKVSDYQNFINHFIKEMNELLKRESELREYKALNNKQKKKINKIIEENKQLIKQAITIRKKKLITNNDSYKLKQTILKIGNNHNTIITELRKPEKIIKFIKEITIKYTPTILKANDLEQNNYYAILSISTNTYRLDVSKKIYNIKPIDVNASIVLLAYHNGLLKPRVKGLKINQSIKKEYLNKTKIKGLLAKNVIMNNETFSIILIEKEAYKRLIEKVKLNNHQIIIDKRFNACLLCFKGKINTSKLGIKFIEELSKNLKTIS